MSDRHMGVRKGKILAINNWGLAQVFAGLLLLPTTLRIII